MPESRGLATLGENLIDFFVPKSPTEGAVMVATSFMGLPAPLGKLVAKGAVGLGAARLLQRLKAPIRQLSDDVAESLGRNVSQQLGKLERTVREAEAAGRPLTSREARRIAQQIDEVETRMAKSLGDPDLKLQFPRGEFGDSALDVERALREIRGRKMSNVNFARRFDPSKVDETGTLVQKAPEGSTLTGGRGRPGSPGDELQARIERRRARVARQRQKPQEEP